MAREAESFLMSQRWCHGIREGSLAWATASVLGVFQFRIDPAEPDVDDILWVVVGDVPPAYLVLDGAPTWREAIEAYVDEMDGWVDAVRIGGTFDDIIPVNVPPTPEHAAMLATRLDLIRANILAVPGESLESDV